MKTWMNATNGGALAVVLSMASLSVWAHGGEDHTHEAETAVSTAPSVQLTHGLRWELQSPDVELVGVIDEGKLTLYADAFRTNKPLANASIELKYQQQHLRLTTDAAGVAYADAQWLATPAQYDVIVTVKAKEIHDLVVGKIDTRALASTKDAPDTETEPAKWWQFWRTIGEWFSSVASAHGGEDHVHEDEQNPAAIVATSPTASMQQPARLADESVFLPKAAQRVLSIETDATHMDDVPKTLTLNANVVIDPLAHASVKPTQNGRILSATADFPVLGTQVKKGQILALLEPTTSNVDKGERAEKIAEINAQLVLAEKNAQRLAQLSGVIPQMEVDAARNTADTLKARIHALQSIPTQANESLRAPITGQITRVDANVGQQANAGDVLFEVLDNTRLQIEALSYDPLLLANLESAFFQHNQQIVPLQFVGSDQQLRQQALPLRFDVMDNTGATLMVGQPLQVTVKTRERIKGFVVPANSVVKRANQHTSVWVHTRAEIFKPYAVDITPLNANSVVITNGLPEGTHRVVTQGAVLLGNIR